MNSFFHTGDLGDVIAALPAVRALRGGEMVIGYRPAGQRESLKGERFESLRALLLAQPYITGVRWGEVGNIDFSRFRERYHDGMNLVDWQACHVGVGISTEPWLTAEPDPRAAGRPVIARSARYHNPQFPWRRILDQLQEPVFVGLPAEHAAFSEEFGPLEYVPTRDLLEMAGLIAAGSIFVGNQSCPFWIALALGVVTVQESFPPILNSVVHRKGAWYPHFSKYELDGILPGSMAVAR